MSITRKPLYLLCALALIASSSSLAEAQYPCGGWYHGYIHGSIARGLPPYFSLFPPVYYSCPVPRTYGYSPFAYPPGTPTPEIHVEPAQAKVMINPFVPRNEVTRPATDQTAQGPLTLINPFVEASTQLAQQL
jgi:hypothetical protein